MLTRVGNACISLVSCLKDVTLYYRLTISMRIKIAYFEFSSLLFKLAKTTNHTNNTICQHSTSAAIYSKDGTWFDAIILKKVKSYTDLQQEFRLFTENITYANKRNFLMKVEASSSEIRNVFTDGDVNFFAQPQQNYMLESCPVAVISMSVLQFCYDVILKPVRMLGNG